MSISTHQDPIDLSRVCVPVYDNANLGHRSRWIDDNLAKLARYWSELGRSLNASKADQEDIEELASWVKFQYDSQFGSYYESYL